MDGRAWVLPAIVVVANDADGKLRRRRHQRQGDRVAEWLELEPECLRVAEARVRECGKGGESGHHQASRQEVHGPSSSGGCCAPAGVGVFTATCQGRASFLLSFPSVRCDLLHVANSSDDGRSKSEGNLGISQGVPRARRGRCGASRAVVRPSTRAPRDDIVDELDVHLSRSGVASAARLCVRHSAEAPIK